MAFTFTQNNYDTIVNGGARIYKKILGVYPAGDYLVELIPDEIISDGVELHVIPNNGIGITSLYFPGSYVPGQGVVNVNFVKDTVAKYASRWTLTVPATLTGSPTLTAVFSTDATARGAEFTQSYLDSLNVELYADSVKIVGDIFVPMGASLELKPKDGFDIVSARIAAGYWPGMVPQPDLLFNVVSPKSAIAYQTLYVDPGLAEYEIETIQAEEDVSGTNHVYLVDAEIVASINNERFVPNPVPDEAPIDYGQYILGLISIPTELAPADILQPETVVLGNRRLTTTAPKIAKDALPFNLGVISVSALGDARDYLGITCVLHLPYAKSVTIDPAYVMGESLGVEYILDCYSGNATINLTSTHVGGAVFHTVETTFGFNIPYTHTGKEAKIYNAAIDVGGNNRTLTPTIEIISKQTENLAGFFTIPVEETGTLEDYSGYVEVDKIAIVFNALGDEAELIKNQLKNGVIIK